MRKVISLFIAVLILLTFSITAFAGVGFSENFIEYDAGLGKISVSYNGYNQEYETSAIVYNVTKIENPTIDTGYVDETTTPIIAIMQESADGSFDLYIEKSFTGRVILVVGSMDGSYVRALLKIEDGAVRSIVIPTEILEDFDADGSMAILGEDDSVKITSGLLKNAIIDATKGTLEIGTTSVSGKVRFDLSGKITADPGDTVILESVVKNGLKSVGIVKGFELTGAANTTLVFTASDGKTMTANYDTDGFIGNAVITAAIQDVPEEITISVDTVLFD